MEVQILGWLALAAIGAVFAAEIWVLKRRIGLLGDEIDGIRRNIPVWIYSADSNHFARKDEFGLVRDRVDRLLRFPVEMGYVWRQKSATAKWEEE